MTFDPTLGQLINAASGALLIGLGLFVALRRPRHRTRIAFGTFSALFGAQFIAAHLGRPALGPGSALEVLNTVGAIDFFLASPALAVFAWVYPRGDIATGRPAQVLAAVVITVWVLTLLPVLDPSRRDLIDVFYYSTGLPAAVSTVSVALIHGVLRGALIIWADRWRRSEDANERRDLALLSAALAVYPAYSAGDAMMRASGVLADSYFMPTVASIGIGSVVLLWMVWTRNAVYGPDRRTAIRLALLIPTIGFIAALYAALVEGGPGGVGLSRTLGVVTIAYALIRYRSLGLDLRIKWTIKQSTLAAIFIAVVFIASELAAQLLSEQMGPILAIIAAGALLFAIVPLQHFAQRVADRAMPSAKATGEMTDDERLDIYRDQVQRAWADGNLSRDERELLSGLRDKLGIDRAEASRIEDQAAAAPRP